MSLEIGQKLFRIIYLSVKIAAIFFSKANKDNDSISVTLPVVWSIDVLMLFHYIDELSS